MFHIIIWFFLFYIATLIARYCIVQYISTPYDDLLEKGGY